MALNDVTFQVLQGGLGKVSAGEDHISALMFSQDAPDSYGAGKWQSFGDLMSVESAGIVEGDADYGQAWYHAREFFRIAPGSTLWIGFSTTYAEMFTATAGKVRQVGVIFSDFATLGSLQQAGVTALTALHAPLVVIAGYQSATTLNLGTVDDLSDNTTPQVAVLLAGDGDAKGAALATTLNVKSVPAVGAVLGALSRAKVHESIAWVEQFNLSDGDELEVIRLPDGNVNPSNSTLSALNDKRYLVFRKHIGIAGTYLNNSHTATTETSDYAYLESNRTIQKARRELRKALLPNLNSPLTVDADTGKLAPGTIKYFETVAARPLNQMQAAGEFSGYGIYINPDQDVLGTSTLTIQVKIVPRGVARHIVVNIGLAVTTSF